MWTYKDSHQFDIPENAFGFVYLIECLLPGQPKSKYLGKKQLTASKIVSKRVLNKVGVKVTKKKKSRVESNWRDYMGSCKPLLEDIKRFGRENYKFTILAFAETKGQLSFLEEYCQMREKVMIDDSYYNDSVGARGFIGVKFTETFKETIRGIKI